MKIPIYIDQKNPETLQTTTNIHTTKEFRDTLYSLAEVMAK
jgi:hypothetical protein